MEHNPWLTWILGIAAVLIAAGVIGIWKLVAGKVGASELDREVLTWSAEIKAVNIRIDQTLVAIAQMVSKTDLIEKMGGASTRADDKDIRVQHDLQELKIDVRSLSEKIAAVDKKLDELPTRVASLEQTRNQNQK